MRHSYSSFWMQCPRNLSFLAFNVAIIVLLAFALFNIEAFATRSLYDIFKLRLRNHIPAASRFLWSSGVMEEVTNRRPKIQLIIRHKMLFRQHKNDFTNKPKGKYLRREENLSTGFHYQLIRNILMHSSVALRIFAFGSNDNCSWP